VAQRLGKPTREAGIGIAVGIAVGIESCGDLQVAALMSAAK
jgi:hypothetical protein